MVLFISIGLALSGMETRKSSLQGLSNNTERLLVPQTFRVFELKMSRCVSILKACSSYWKFYIKDRFGKEKIVFSILGLQEQTNLSSADNA